MRKAYLKEAKDELRFTQNVFLAMRGGDGFEDRQKELMDEIHKLEGTYEEIKKQAISDGWAFFESMATKKEGKK